MLQTARFGWSGFAKEILKLFERSVEMVKQEKLGPNSERLIRYFEDSLTKRIPKFKKIVENCKNNTQYQQDKDFRGQCDSMEGLLVDMLKDLEIVRRAKHNE